VRQILIPERRGRHYSKKKKKKRRGRHTGIRQYAYQKKTPATPPFNTLTE